MLNKVILIGRLGNKPELKTSKQGTSYCGFTMATNTGFGDKKRTDWHNVTCFGKLAESCANYTNKGDLVSVTGTITYDKYEDSNGIKHNTTKIIADSVVFLTTKKMPDAEPQTAQPNAPGTQEQFYDPQMDDNVIPF